MQTEARASVGAETNRAALYTVVSVVERDVRNAGVGGGVVAWTDTRPTPGGRVTALDVWTVPDSAGGDPARVRYDLVGQDSIEVVRDGGAERVAAYALERLVHDGAGFVASGGASGRLSEFSVLLLDAAGSPGAAPRRGTRARRARRPHRAVGRRRGPPGVPVGVRVLAPGPRRRPLTPSAAPAPPHHAFDRWDASSSCSPPPPPWPCLRRARGGRERPAGGRGHGRSRRPHTGPGGDPLGPRVGPAGGRRGRRGRRVVRRAGHRRGDVPGRPVHGRGRRLRHPTHRRHGRPLWWGGPHGPVGLSGGGDPGAAAVHGRGPGRGVATSWSRSRSRSSPTSRV